MKCNGGALTFRAGIPPLPKCCTYKLYINGTLLTSGVDDFTDIVQEQRCCVTLVDTMGKIKITCVKQSNSHKGYLIFILFCICNKA